MASSIKPDYLERAHTTLRELFQVLEQSKEKTVDEYQQLRRMKLALSRKRKTSVQELEAILFPLIDDMVLSEESLQDILLELRRISKAHHALVFQCLDRLLRKALSNREAHDLVDKLLISLIMHVKTASDHEASVAIVRDSLDVIAETQDYQLEKIPATATLTLLWQYGDQCYNAKKWSDAVDWFLLGTHDAFVSVMEMAGSKCLRKAALCRIQDGHYARASEHIERCSSKEATTSYLAFLVAAHQGRTDEAIHALGTMINATDFDRKMLMLAMNLARQLENQSLLHAILERLLETLRRDGDVDEAVQRFTLIRCLVRLTLSLMEHPGAETKQLLPILRRHFETGLTVLRETANSENKIVVNKDVSWLWRTAYNCAVKGLGTWADADVTNMFVLARRYMDASCSMALLEPEADIQGHRILAQFAAVSGQLFSARAEERPEQKDISMRLLVQEIDNLQALIEDQLRGEPEESTNRSRSQTIFHLSLVYQAEIFAELKEWEAISTRLKTSGQKLVVPITTYEAIADILWSDKSCPVVVLYDCLESIVKMTTTQGQISIKKFSRWMRAICTILLSKGRVQDRSKALSYVQQAIVILKEYGTGDEPTSEMCYPEDERSWLLSTAFNTGIECMRSLQVREAQEWLEAATQLCDYVRGSPREKVEATYRQFLAQYGH